MQFIKELFRELKEFNEVDVKANWAKAVNDPTNKPYKDETYGNKMRGKINSKHYMMYNAMRGLPLDRGFDSSGETINLLINRITYERTVAERRNTNDIVFPFGVTEKEFQEKWDEAVRLYNRS